MTENRVKEGLRCGSTRMILTSVQQNKQTNKHIVSFKNDFSRCAVCKYLDIFFFSGVVILCWAITVYVFLDQFQTDYLKTQGYSYIDLHIAGQPASSLNEARKSFGVVTWVEPASYKKEWEHVCNIWCLNHVLLLTAKLLVYPTPLQFGWAQLSKKKKKILSESAWPYAKGSALLGTCITGSRNIFKDNDLPISTSQSFFVAVTCK